MELLLHYRSTVDGAAEYVTLTLGGKTLLAACSCCQGVNSDDISILAEMARLYAETPRPHPRGDQ